MEHKDIKKNIEQNPEKFQLCFNFLEQIGGDNQKVVKAVNVSPEGQDIHEVVVLNNFKKNCRLL